MGRPFQVNSYENNWQRNPVILPQKDGGYLIVWESYLNEYDDGPSATYIAGQYFSAGGTPIGNELVLAGADGTSSTGPSIARLADGGFVLTWMYDDYDDILTLDTEIRAAVFNANGSLRRDEFRVDTVASNDAVRPVVAGTGDGGFVISWGIDSSTGNFDQVYGRAYTAGGAAKGPNFLVNSRVQDFDQIISRSATMEDGRTIIIWKSEATIDNGGAGQSDIRASIINPNGTVFRADFQLAPSRGSAGTPYDYGYDVTALKGGGFAMVQTLWTFQFYNDTDRDGTVNTIQLFDRLGAPQGRGIRVYETGEVMRDMRVAQLESGEIVVVWHQSSETPGQIGDDAYGRILRPNGTPQGPVFQIGTNLDNYTDQEDLEVEALAGGGFIVAYMDEGIDSDDDGIAAQVFGRGTDSNDNLTVDVTGSMSGLGGNDRLIGTIASNVLSGGSGNDVLIGSYGNDTLVGGPGQDTAVFIARTGVKVDLLRAGSQNTGEGLDVLSGIENVTAAAGNDFLWGSQGNNRLVGAGGNDHLSGRAGNDVLLGGIGLDRLDGGAGNDVLDGGAGADMALYLGAQRITVNLALDRAHNTGMGIDLLRNIEMVRSGSGNDVLYGNAGANTLMGGTGNDLIRGQAGADRIVGEAGNDNLGGGAGADTFVFSTLSGRDVIVDFQPAFDVIRIDLPGNGTTTDVDVLRAPGGTLIDWDTSWVRLVGVVPSQIDDDNLILY
ncbi:hypothetical protein MLD63_09730 [Paracoccus sp. TK19116]|uniref:Calcium-binding protein n=1 Tax=Paracoccus albicereus TaxID=2922394 RepID=A0ABT1MQY7_9RHOB|nr:calcium-binding protein [Paracoccus albicereus]MCQ0970703.1 hypothetical protein [Paracoccus albicereus]